MLLKKIILIRQKTISMGFTHSVLYIWMLRLNTAKPVRNFTLERSTATLIYLMRHSLWQCMASFLEILAWVFWVQKHLFTQTLNQFFVNSSSATRTSGKQVVIVLPDKLGLFEVLVRKGQSKTAFGCNNPHEDPCELYCYWPSCRFKYRFVFKVSVFSLV